MRRWIIQAIYNHGNPAYSGDEHVSTYTINAASELQARRLVLNRCYSKGKYPNALRNAEAYA